MIVADRTNEICLNKIDGCQSLINNLKAGYCMYVVMYMSVYITMQSV